MIQRTIMNGLRNLSKDEPAWLKDLRVQAFNFYDSTPLPRFKYGISLFTSLVGLNLESINLLDSDEDIEISNVGKATVMNISDALKHENYSKLVKEYFMQKAFYFSEDKLTALHSAFWKNGLFVYIPEGVSQKIPIQIKTNLKSDYAGSHVLVIAEPNSKASILEINESSVGQLKTQGVEVFLMKGAKLTYSTFQNLDNDVWHFNIQRAILAKDAQMDWFTASLGSKLSKVEVSTDLQGEGAAGKNIGIFIGTNGQRFDTYNSAIHSAPNTHSDMHNKGIVLEKAKSIYRGLINIKENAKNSDGYQKQDTLILSQEAEADAVPNLEINNNEVRCSHGATIGQVDEEKLYYMMSRGLTRKEAEKQIIVGFLSEIIEKTESELLKKMIKENISKRLK